MSENFDDDVERAIPISGFDEGGEPELLVMKNGQVVASFEFMPPSDYDDRDAFDGFDEEMAAAIGTEVQWEDREWFVIPAPRPDTVERLVAFLSGYRKQLADK